MIIIAIEHINGEIAGPPFIIDKDNIYKYTCGSYLVYIIDYINKTIKEIV